VGRTNLKEKILEIPGDSKSITTSMGRFCRRSKKDAKRAGRTMLKHPSEIEKDIMNT